MVMGAIYGGGGIAMLWMGEPIGLLGIAIGALSIWCQEISPNG